MPLIPSSIPPVFHSSQPIFIGRTSWSPTLSPIRASLPSLTGSSPHYLHPRSLNISCSLSITPHRRIATPYVPRNVRDQPAFDTFTGEAEANKNSEDDQGHFQIAVVYLCHPTSFYFQLFAHVFGNNAGEESSVDYCRVLVGSTEAKRAAH